MLKISDSKDSDRKSPFQWKAWRRSRRGRVKKSKVEKPPRVINYEKLIRTLGKLKPRYLNLALLIPILVLSMFGLLMVLSASSYNAQYYFGNPHHFFTKQLIGFVLGAVLLTCAYHLDYSFLQKKPWLVWLAGVIVLCLVFIPGIGIERLGARRWIGFGGFTIQPSEIAKFAFVIFAAAMLSKCDFTASRFRTVLKVLAAGGIMCALILAEPNLSITLCLGITIFCMLFLCGARIKHIAIIAAPALVLLPVLLVAEPYRIRRLLAFVDPWSRPKDEGFQLIQSLFGLGNGGLTGVGYGNSTQKYMFLPFSESDFIFSVIGEEFGLLGCIAFILLLGFIIFQIFMVARRAKDNFGRYLCYGIATIIFVQSAINLAVVTGSIPPTGLPLPFISFGGTSLAVFMTAIGIVLNVDKQSRQMAYKSKT
jgi:cell division protein FtsW